MKMSVLPFLFALACALSGAVAHAEKADNNKPMNIESDALRYDDLKQTSVFTGRVVMTSEIIGLQWNTVVLYPAGHFVSGIQVQPWAKLPNGWQTGTALDLARRDGDWFEFKPVSLETLVDSPLWASSR